MGCRVVTYAPPGRRCPIPTEEPMTATYEHFSSRTPGVLVVDASPRVRALLGQRLRNHGFAVWRAAGGLEAVEVYRRNPGIDLVLIDADMAVMDGPRTVAALRGLDAGVRCCFLSGEPG